MPQSIVHHGKANNGNVQQSATRSVPTQVLSSSQIKSNRAKMTTLNTRGFCGYFIRRENQICPVSPAATR